MSEKLQVEGIGSIEVASSERGKGQPILLLHGGAGPLSVVPWAEMLARTRPARVIIPTHPGFMGTPRPEALDSVAKLARVYAALMRKLALDGATIIGNSIGGWIAVELALVAPALVKKLVLVDAAGIEVPGHPVADVFSLSPDELSRRSYHDPERFRIDFSKLTPEQRAMAAANFATLKSYGGDKADPQLRARLRAIANPTLVVWGEADRITDADYGRAYAEAIPNARFQLLAGAGHLPQIETPQLLADTIWPFIAE
jgi:pimeloyl-ACP methyl ester carboxylesterase